MALKGIFAILNSHRTKMRKHPDEGGADIEILRCKQNARFASCLTIGRHSMKVGAGPFRSQGPDGSVEAKAARRQGVGA